MLAKISSFICQVRKPTRMHGLRQISLSIQSDTIYALSSGPIVKSGVAVIRISGPSSRYCVEQLACTRTDNSVQLAKSLDDASSINLQSLKQEFPRSRFATLRKLRNPETAEVLDQALVLWFPGPRSFTGEDVAELHVHGSRAVIQGVFDALGQLDKPDLGQSVRAAAPGEFTRRAFENGKMDLTEVEGLGDLLAAETSKQRKQALKQMDGHMRRKYESWRYNHDSVVIGLILSCINPIATV